MRNACSMFHDPTHRRYFIEVKPGRLIVDLVSSVVDRSVQGRRNFAVAELPM